MRSTPLPFIAVALILSFSACRDPQIESYRVPKEKESAPPTASATPRTAPTQAPATPAPSLTAPTPSANADMANTAVRTADGPGLSWTAPAHWIAKPASAMRKGTYAITGEAGAAAELSITAFPGSVGGDLANINRWRGQVQLPPITASDLPSATRKIDANGFQVTTVDFAGTAAGAPTRVLGAIVPVGDSTWFFKLTGPVGLLEREQATFTAFLLTIRSTGAQP